MKKKFFFIFIIISLNLSAINPFKPLQQSIHTVWTTKHGLPSDSINDIIQDKNGYIWIGTFNGLVRFDGINFHVFSRHDKKGFKSNSVTKIYESSDGALWIGTSGDGLARYYNGKFSMYAGSGLKDKIIKTISGDNSGYIWLGTGNGLIKTDGKDIIRDPLNGVYRDKDVEMVYHDLNGNLWISTSDGGVSVYSGKSKKSIPALDNLNGSIVLSVLHSDGGKFWIGTRNNGLHFLKNGTLTHFGPNKGFNAKTVTALTKGGNGCVWIGTDSGLYRDNKFGLFRFSEDNGLSNNQVSKILIDKEESIWIATSRGGINKLSDGKFTTITPKNGLVHDKVNVIFNENESRLWIGTDGGLSVLDKEKFVNLPITSMLKGVRIRHINKDSKGTIWICTYSEYGLVSIKNGKIRIYTKKSGLAGNRCRVSMEDSSGNIWVGTSSGLNRIAKNGKIYTYKKKDGLTDNYILSIFEDSKNVLWITTNGGGISFFKDGRFGILTVKDGISSNVVFRTYEDSDNILWFYTSKGLSRYDRENFFNFSETNGISENSVFQVLEDKKGRFWIITETEIFTVKKRDLNKLAKKEIDFVKTTFYNNMDGLLDSPTPVSWSVITKSGINWFPTLKGVATIDTMNIPINKKAPPLIIESVRVDNKKFYPNDINELSPSYKRLTFTYTALSYVIPHKVQYKYKLEGFDNSWSKLTTKREVSYTTLPPGNYTFRVKAINNDGVWNENDVAIRFVQNPFFYQTLWFLLLTVFSIIGIIALIFGLRIRSLRRREAELEKLVAERTAELEATDKIVANINKEINFDMVLRVLVQQTMSLFPQADKGVILTYNNQINLFEPKVFCGYKESEYKNIELTLDEISNRYLKNGIELERGIYILQEFNESQTQKKFENLEKPASMIAMTITAGNTLEGFFLLENMSNSMAFSELDAKKMMRIREHAISAIEKAKTHRKLEEAAILDPLTSLNNRRKMIEVLEGEMTRSERTGKSFCIVMADVDKFKEFNDTFGHDCGDYVLIEVSKLIKSTIRKQDIVGRWGGEEFLLVYPETGLDGARTVTEKVRSTIENKIFVFNNIELKITVTFGITEFNKDSSIDSSIKNADDALYIGKQRGRNCIVSKPSVKSE